MSAHNKLMEISRMNNRTKHTCIKEYEPDASFYEKVLEAMDETERKKIPPEKTAQMLQKIRHAAKRNRTRRSQ